MSQDESHENLSSRPLDALRLGPRKRSCPTDPLVHHGRHFGRTIHALCNVNALVTNGMLHLQRLAEQPEEEFSAEERREHKVFCSLMTMVPGLEERLMNPSTTEEEVQLVATMLQKGASGARSDDTKSLKSAIIDWLTPPGEPLVPPIARNVKVDRGFNHEITGALLCPAGVDWSDQEVKQKLRTGELSIAGDQWPIFLYIGYKFYDDDPWRGLLRSTILLKTYKHIFTSPSSVEREAKATRSGNARIHGMTRVTPASIAYAATQARFALSSSPVFTRSDTVTDSERFYNSILDLLEDHDEVKEVDDLLTWWNSQIFPNYSQPSRPISKDSALAKIKAKRAAMKERAALISTDINQS